MTIDELGFSFVNRHSSFVIYLERFRPVFSQCRSTGHLLHQGETGTHKFWPKVTRISLKVFQYFFGSFSRSSNSVSSGVLVVTYPHRLVILWTCVSTQMP